MSQNVTHPFEDYVVEENPAKVAPKHRKLVDFQRDLDTELGKAFATSLHPYDQVHVLLLCWQTTDSDNLSALKALRDFLEQEFYYKVRIFEIEGTGLKPDHKSLANELRDINEASNERTLTIIGYSGHGFSTSIQLNRRERRDLRIFPRNDIWKTSSFNSSTPNFGIDYSDIYKYLFRTEGDVLHLLECCCGGGATLDGPHEVLAASATHKQGKRLPKATPSGRFFNAVVSSMTDLKRTHGAFTTVQLHAHAVNTALDFAPESDTQPFYAGKFEDEKKPITLAPLFPGKTNPLLRPRMLVKEAKVLLSIALSHGKQKIKDMFKEMRVWLSSRDRPIWVKSVDVGVLPSDSNSAVMLITLPVSLWDVLPEHPAYKIDLGRNGNILLSNLDQRLLR